MNYLLDSHALIWWSNNSVKISPKALAILHNKNNLIFLSLASVWEMQIKVDAGKLSFPLPFHEFIAEQRQHSFYILEIQLNHVHGLAALPHHHKDPFDRMLISQSMFVRYPVRIVW